MRRSEFTALLLGLTLALTTVTGSAGAWAERPPSPSDVASPVEPPPAVPGGPDLTPAETLAQAEAAVGGVAAANTPDVPGAPAAESPTLALSELLGAYPELTASQRVRADALLARPDGEGAFEDPIHEWATDPDLAHCGPRVCVHWTESMPDAPPIPDTDADSVPDWVETTLEVMEDVWDTEVGALGYRAPASDGLLGDLNGETDKFDVYLSQLAPNYYGYCVPENKVPGEPRRASGYCVLDNDYIDYPKAPLPSLQVTAAHEFFHAIQFNYDYREDDWFKEATATWVEERYADSVNDNRDYLRFGQLGKPAKPLDTFGGLAHYGNWLFFERLSAKYGVNSVRKLWNRLDGSVDAPNHYSTQALKGFLSAQGTSLPTFYASFAAGNLTPGRSYAEGTAYRASPLVDSFKLKAGRTSIRPQTKKLRHLTSASYRIKAAKSLRSARRLKIVIDGPQRATSPVVVAYTYFKSGKITKKTIKLTKSGAGSTKVTFNRTKVTKVTLTLVNASTRFVCKQGSTFSCGGVARDEPEKFVFTVLVLR